jgi:hypothetical protein
MDSNIEQLIKNFISRIKSTYTTLQFGYYYEQSDDTYVIWYNLRESQIDDELLTLIGENMSEIFYCKNIFNIFCYNDLKIIRDYEINESIEAVRKTYAKDSNITCSKYNNFKHSSITLKNSQVENNTYYFDISNIVNVLEKYIVEEISNNYSSSIVEDNNTTCSKNSNNNLNYSGITLNKSYRGNNTYYFDTSNIAGVLEKIVITDNTNNLDLSNPKYNFSCYTETNSNNYDIYNNAA